jgi:hypothetical protein
VKHFEIIYDAGSSSGSSTIDYGPNDDRQTAYELATGGSGSQMIPEDAVITVSVNMDGNIQAIELTSRAVH